MNHRLLDRIKLCTILNDYDGFSELEQLAVDNPQAAFGVAWNVLRYTEDPGRDDGALSANLAKVCMDSMGVDAYAHAVAKEWGELPPGIRANLIEGFVDQRFPKSVVMNVFRLHDSTVADRHGILSTIVSSRFEEFREELVEMMSEVGEHDDPNRQAGLVRLVDSIKGVL